MGGINRQCKKTKRPQAIPLLAAQRNESFIARVLLMAHPLERRELRFGDRICKLQAQTAATNQLLKKKCKKHWKRIEILMLTFYFPGLAVAVFSHIQATAILHSWRLHIKGACVERELQVSCSSTSKQRSTFRNHLHNVLYMRVQSDCLTKLRVGTLLRLKIFLYFFF